MHAPNRGCRLRSANMLRARNNDTAGCDAVMDLVASRPSRAAFMTDDAALMLCRCAVVDGRLAITAPDPTATKVGVELLEHLRGHLADQHVAEYRVEVQPGVALVALPGVLIDLVDPQPLLHRDAERRLGSSVRLLVNLDEQSPAKFLSFVQALG